MSFFFPTPPETTFNLTTLPQQEHTHARTRACKHTQIYFLPGMCKHTWSWLRSMSLCFHQEPTWIYDVPKKKKDTRPSGLVLCLVSFFFYYYYLYFYLCILSECHSNGRMNICMTTGWGAEGAPGSDSIHKQEPPPPPPPYLQYSLYGLTNANTVQPSASHNTVC